MGQVNFCIVFKGLCDLAEGRIVDREVKFDNIDRSDVYYSMSYCKLDIKTGFIFFKL